MIRTDGIGQRVARRTHLLLRSWSAQRDRRLVPIIIVLTGWTGQLSLAPLTFLGVGGCTTAILSQNSVLRLPFWAVIPSPVHVPSAVPQIPLSCDLTPCTPVVLWATAFTAASDADGCVEAEAPAPGAKAAASACA